MSDARKRWNAVVGDIAGLDGLQAIDEPDAIMSLILRRDTPSGFEKRLIRLPRADFEQMADAAIERFLTFAVDEWLDAPAPEVMVQMVQADDPDASDEAPVEVLKSILSEYET